MQVLDLLDRLMNRNKRDPVYEAVPESLKNVILVMYASEVLVRPSQEHPQTKEQKDLWNLTSDRLERFLPGFLLDVLGAPSSPPMTQTLLLPANVSSMPSTPTSLKPKSTSIL